MELLSPLLHLSLIHLLMAMVPGPNTVVVGHCSAQVSRRAGLSAAAGVAAASVVWVSLSLLGIGALLLHAGELFRLLRLLGAAYLVYIGVKMLLVGGGAAAETPRLYRSPLRAGFLTTLGNPKSAIFWTSVFSVVVPAQAPSWFYGMVLALIGTQSFLWYGTIAMTFSLRVVRNGYARLNRIFTRIAGGCMLFFGLRIVDELRQELGARAV